MLAVGKGGDQHEERGLREVEVGEEALDDFEFVALIRMGAGREEEAGGAGVGGDVGLGAGDMFEGAGGGGAYGEDAAFFADGFVDGFGGGGGEGVGLGVEADVFGAFYADGLEGAEAYVEGEVRDFDAACGEGLENLGSEVQAGGGSGGGASFVGEDGLVAGAVFGGVGFGFFAVDVGRKREMADAV